MANREHVKLLRRGVEVWNRWRKKQFKVVPDLSELDFHQILKVEDICVHDLYEQDGQVVGKKRSFRGVCLRNFDFHKADLSRANLSGADLSNVNLGRANLSKSNLKNAQLGNAYLGGVNLSDANLSNAYIYDADLTEANLSRTNLVQTMLTNVHLHGSDLSEANLSGATLTNTFLSGANLGNACLYKANLARTQALETDFTGAVLTGACLEDWNINSTTILNGVVCEYIYLEQCEQERRPSNGNFRSGEFALLLQKALSTVDLIFTDGIDWQAFFQSFQELQLRYDDLSIQAVEKKSGDAFVIRLEVPSEIDKAAIESHAKELYEMKLQLQEQRYRAELQVKDGQISLYQEQLEFHRQNNTNLMEIVKTMAEKENQPTHQTIINAQTIGATHTGSGDITNFTQNINSNIDDITKLLTALRDSAQSLPETQREEALVHLNDLQEDLSQPEKQKPSRLKTRLVALFAIASTASGVVVGATDFGNKVLDLSKKLGIELVQTPPNQQLPPSK